MVDRPAEHVPGERRRHPGLRHRGAEDGGQQQAAVGVLPAQGGLLAGHATVREVDDRLPVHDHLLAVQCAGELAGQAHRGAVVVDGRVVDLGPRPPAALGAVERGVGGGQQAGRARGRGRGGSERDTDARPDRHGVPMDPDRLAQTGVDRTSDLLGRPRAVGGLEQDDELVTAETCDRAERPRRGAHDARDVHEDVVTGGVAVPVVDGLEAVEVAREQRDPVLRTRALEGLLEDVEQQRAVGQAGQRVVQGAMGQARGRLAVGGDVPGDDDDVVTARDEDQVEHHGHRRAVRPVPPLLEPDLRPGARRQCGDGVVPAGGGAVRPGAAGQHRAGRHAAARRAAARRAAEVRAAEGRARTPRPAGEGPPGVTEVDVGPRLEPGTDERREGTVGLAHEAGGVDERHRHRGDLRRVVQRDPRPVAPRAADLRDRDEERPRLARQRRQGPGLDPDPPDDHDRVDGVGPSPSPAATRARWCPWSPRTTRATGNAHPGDDRPG